MHTSSNGYGKTISNGAKFTTVVVEEENRLCKMSSITAWAARGSTGGVEEEEEDDVIATGADDARKIGGTWCAPAVVLLSLLSDVEIRFL